MRQRQSFRLSRDEIVFFQQFGFLRLRSIVERELTDICHCYEISVAAVSDDFPGGQKITVRNFLSQHEQLRSIVQAQWLREIGLKLLGHDYKYITSDACLLTGDTTWHVDSFAKEQRLIKVAIYLDELSAASGALRVIPGSHRSEFGRDAWRAVVMAPASGVGGDRIPGYAIESSPGDVVVFAMDLLHSAWGEPATRRQVAIVLSSGPTTTRERAEFDRLILSEKSIV